MSDFKTLKGNPTDVAEAAERLRTAADNMRSARLDIGRMVTFSNFSSRAVETITENADEVRTALLQAQRRYDAAADALREWSQDMETAQLEAKAAAQDHDTATTNLTNAQADYDNARDDQKASGASDEEVDAAKSRAKTADGLVDAAHTARSAAWSNYQDAVDYYNAGAAKAAKKINKANEDTNDTWREWRGAIFKWAWDLHGKYLEILDELLTIVGIALLVALVVVAIVFTGPFGVAVAAALLAAMTVVGVLSAIVKTIRYARGEGSGWEVVVAWVFIAAPGVGKVAKVLLKPAAKGKRVATKPGTSRKGGGTAPPGGRRSSPEDYQGPRHRREPAPIKPREEAGKAVRDHVLKEGVNNAPEHFRNRRNDPSSNRSYDFRDAPPTARPRPGSTAPIPVCRVGG